MEVLAEFFTSLWNALDDCPNIPVIDISIKEFLLIILIINLTFAFVGIFFGKSSSAGKDNDK